jgi:hypothetical protein
MKNKRRKAKLPDNQNRLFSDMAHFSGWLILVIVLAGAGLRIRLLEVPLERDEGEYAYAGQLILQAEPPYGQVYNMKLPGIYAAYAMIMAFFGQSCMGIHLGLLIINAATVFLLYLLAKRLFGVFAGLVAAAAFAFTSAGQPVQGVFANAEHFVILPAIAGILLLVKALDCGQKRLFLLSAGLLLGLAFLMKQHGIAFIGFAGGYLVFRELRLRPFNWKNFLTDCLIFSAGLLLPFALTCVVLWRCGVFAKFWFWTFDYARQYVTSVPLTAGLTLLKQQLVTIAGASVFIWLLAGIGLTALFWNRKMQHRIFAGGFVFFSFLSVCPGLYFRPHYFVLLLPAVGLLAGIGAQSLLKIAGTNVVIKQILVVLIAASLMLTIYQQRDFLFAMSAAEASRATYSANPFPESVEIGRFIKENSDPDDKIAILGSEPQIFFYAHRRSATGYIYTYPLMELQPYALQMQHEMIDEIERSRPEFLVVVDIPTSWLRQSSSETLIFEWLKQYQQQYYRRVGVVDIISAGQTVYQWDDNAADYLPRSPYRLWVLKRKDDI